jgi:hypothetical protein
MRVRNGEDWLEAAVLSHLLYLDEVVAVYNECTDRTPEILAGLQAAHPQKIRVFHYLPRVHPVGSEMHIRTPADSVHSIANYYNFSLSLTQCTLATKLDDDHIAMPAKWASLRSELSARGFRLGNEIWCFSGLNLVRQGSELRVHARVPFAGNGDHWFFEVDPRRVFTKDPRFERFQRKGLNMRFLGIAYWHLKYLKKDHGFSNYELEANPRSRYHKQKQRFEAGKSGITLEALAAQIRARSLRHHFIQRLLSVISDKHRLVREREKGLDPVSLGRELESVSRIINGGETAPHHPPQGFM